MHNWSSRVNQLCSNITFALAVIAAFNAISAFWLCEDPIIHKFESTGVRMLYTGNRTVQIGYDGRPIQLKSDIAQLTFMLDADFTPLFNWNTKLLFVFITAHFKSKKHEVNKVVVWDKIVKSEEANLVYQNVVTKYPLVDPDCSLRSNKVKFKLWWSQVPFNGLIWENSLASSDFVFPSTYS